MLSSEVELYTHRLHFGEDCRARVALLCFASIPILTIPRDLPVHSSFVEFFQVYFSLLETENIGIILFDKGFELTLGKTRRDSIDVPAP